MKRIGWTTTFALMLGTAASGLWAHGGVTNEAVLARMEGMKAISDQMKVLSQTVKGEREFDAATIEAALERLSAEAGEIVPLFQAEEDDPKSEALPAIWSDFDGFTVEADALAATVTQWRGQVMDKAAAQEAFMDIGQTCRSCHGSYRE